MLALSISPISVPILQYLAAKPHGLRFEVLRVSLFHLKRGFFCVFALFCFSWLPADFEGWGGAGEVGVKHIFTTFHWMRL